MSPLHELLLKPFVRLKRCSQSLTQLLCFVVVAARVGRDLEALGHGFRLDACALLTVCGLSASSSTLLLGSSLSGMAD